MPSTTRPIDGARAHLAQGRQPIPIPYREKGPTIGGWQKLVIPEVELSVYFNGAALNVGVLCGAPSHGQVCVDVDAPEAEALAPLFLPETTFQDGRDDKDPVHYWYTALGDALKTRRFDDPHRKKMQGKEARTLELLADGAQAIVWPSVHPDGPMYRRLPEGTPPTIDYGRLLRRVTRLHCATLLTRYWPAPDSHVRHEFSLALAGALYDVMNEEPATAFVIACADAAGDEEANQRGVNVRTSFAKIRAGEQARGWPTLKEYLPDLIVTELERQLFKRQEVLAPIRVFTAPPAPPEPPPATDAPEEEAERSRRNLTDLGNAERLVDAEGERIRYALNRGWLVYDGRRWAHDVKGFKVTGLAAKTVRDIYREAAEEVNNKERARIVQHAVSSERAARIAGMVGLVPSLYGITVEASLFDADPYLLNFTNGTLNLKTGKLQPHRREDYLTRVVPRAYVPAARCPVFLDFLTHIMDGRAQLVRYLQRALGMTLTGDTSERVVLILWGGGRNGKSTLTAVMREVLGDDYALNTPAETLLAKRDTGIPNDIARLDGVRLVTASETDEGRRLAEGRLKNIAGGMDKVSARFLHGEWFDFVPQFTLWLATNHRPEVKDTTDSTWDRLKLIPFTVRIDDAALDPHLLGKLRTEIDGIMAWAVQGCLDWQREGLEEPEEVRAATKEYREDMDVIGAFLDACCTLGKWHLTPASSLYRAYAAWCESAKEHPVPQQAFGRKLAERGFEAKRVGHDMTRSWAGVGLKEVQEQRS